MAHEYAVRLTPKDTGETVSLAGKFEDEDWQRLEDFAQYTMDLLSTKFVRDGISVSLIVHWDEKSGSVISSELPLWDDVMVFLHKFRPLGLESEGTFFYSICNILMKELAHPYFRTIIEEQRGVFSGKRMQAQTRVLSGDTILNSDKVLYAWLNSFEYHRDKEKREFIESLHTAFPLEASKALFLVLLAEKAQAINNIAAIIQVVLGKQESVSRDMKKPNDERKT